MLGIFAIKNSFLCYSNFLASSINKIGMLFLIGNANAAASDINSLVSRLNLRGVLLIGQTRQLNNFIEFSDEVTGMVLIFC